MKTIALAESLGLPDGWTATRFSSTITLEHESGKRAGIPIPYNPMTAEEWKQVAAEAIKEP